VQPPRLLEAAADLEPTLEQRVSDSRILLDQLRSLVMALLGAPPSS